MTAVTVLSAFSALLVGFFVGWAACAFVEARRRRADTTTLGALLQQIATQELERGAQRWLQLSDEKERLLKEQLSHYKEQLTQLLTPLAEHLRALEQQRHEAYGRLDAAIRGVIETNLQLRTETAQLTRALSQPQARGRWGEMTLRRVVELAGMVPRVDFVEQTQVGSGDEAARPDMIVRLPNGHSIAVDAKIPLDAYLQACQATDDAQRKQLFELHARKLRDMVNKLATKAYAEKIGNAADFVVVFVPGEQFLSAALAHDDDLLDYALGKKIVLATPSTLLALLRVVAEGWRAAEIHANVEHIKGMGLELYNRFSVLLGYIKDIADGLMKAIKAYNSAISSLNARLMPMIKEFGKLQGNDTTRLPQLNAIDAGLDIPRSWEKEE